jgi:hypothetical protein
MRRAKHGSTETSLAWLGTVWRLLGWRYCALCLGEERPDCHQNKADMFSLNQVLKLDTRYSQSSTFLAREFFALTLSLCWISL